MTKPMIENSDRGVTLNKSLAWTVGCGLIGAGLYVGTTVATLSSQLDEQSTGTAHARGVCGAHLTSTTSVDHFCHRSGNNMEIQLQIAKLPQDPAASGAEIGGGTLATGSPTITGGSAGQSHALGGDTLATSAPALTGGALGQIHAIAETTLTTAAPALTGCALSQSHAVDGAEISTAPPAISGGSIGQSYAFGGAPITTAAPAFEAGGGWASRTPFLAARSKLAPR